MNFIRNNIPNFFLAGALSIASGMAGNGCVRNNASARPSSSRHATDILNYYAIAHGNSAPGTEFTVPTSRLWVTRNQTNGFGHSVFNPHFSTFIGGVRVQLDESIENSQRYPDGAISTGDRIHVEADGEAYDIIPFGNEEDCPCLLIESDSNRLNGMQFLIDGGRFIYREDVRHSSTQGHQTAQMLTRLQQQYQETLAEASGRSRDALLQMFRNLIERNSESSPTPNSHPIRDISIGSPMPALSAQAVLGTSPVDLARLRGRVVLLEFGATWCQPCRDSIPSLNQWHQQFSGPADGLTVLSIMDENRDRLRNFGQENHAQYTLATDSVSIGRFRIQNFPTFILIDRAGNVQHIQVGNDTTQIERWIRQLLSESR